MWRREGWPPPLPVQRDPAATEAGAAAGATPRRRRARRHAVGGRRQGQGFENGSEC